VLNVLKLKGKHFIDPKRSEILSVFQVFSCTTQIALFGQNCPLPFSLSLVDIPALLKSWQKHYKCYNNEARLANHENDLLIFSTGIIIEMLLYVSEILIGNPQFG
jgi:hypothetical protein